MGASHLKWILLSLLVIYSVTAQDAEETGERLNDYADQDPNEQPLLYWVKILYDAGGIDLDPEVIQTWDQGPGTVAQRALTISQLAMYDAVNAIDGSYTPYLLEPKEEFRGASIPAAIHKAALLTLSALYPQQESSFNQYFNEAIAGVPDGEAKTLGLTVGSEAAVAILLARENDGNENQVEYIPFDLPGVHDADPNNPDQGFVTPWFGQIKPFAMDQFNAGGTAAFRLPPPPTVFSEEYAEAYNEIKDKGADGIINPTTRTDEELIIGLTWAYDGFPRVGTPPKAYTQVVRSLAVQQGLSLIEQARLFGLTALAMGDAAIVAWDSKYYYRHWRAVRGIRNGHRDGNPLTEVDEDWSPHGVPQSNVDRPRPPFTAAFPSYPSGHATIGGAMFKMLENYFERDDVPFQFLSDELNGITRDAEFGTRPYRVRSFDSFSQAAEDNCLSRIYLGVHWRFDVFPGTEYGGRVSDWVYANFFRPRNATQSQETEVETALVEAAVVEATVVEEAVVEETELQETEAQETEVQEAQVLEVESQETEYYPPIY